MVKVLRIKFHEIFNVYKMLNKKENGEYSFYSDFNEGLLKYLATRQCYFFINNSQAVGMLLINKKHKDIHYIPLRREGISLFRLIFTLKSNFNLSGYTLSVKHRNLNPKLYSSYFPVNIFEDYKYMFIHTDEFRYINTNNAENLVFRKMLINKEEPIRVKLQNNIFGNSSSGRRELTLLEVYNEEGKSSFLKNMCYILETADIPIGYGQILISEGEYYLVNFGITKEYRKLGYGRYFLMQIIHDCKNNGIYKLNLCVENKNLPAVMLYKKLGFKESFNNFILRFR